MLSQSDSLNKLINNVLHFNIIDFLLGMYTLGIKITREKYSTTLMQQCHLLICFDNVAVPSYGYNHTYTKIIKTHDAPAKAKMNS